MNQNTAVKRLEALQKIVQAARDTDYSYPSRFTEGISTGLRIALDAIDAELQSVRALEAPAHNQ